MLVHLFTLFLVKIFLCSDIPTRNRSMISTKGTYVSAGALIGPRSFLTEPFTLGMFLIKSHCERHFRNALIQCKTILVKTESNDGVGKGVSEAFTFWTFQLRTIHLQGIHHHSHMCG